MQFKVPQNIDMEDKIIGPLTLIQFLYLIGGGLIIYVSRELFSPLVLTIITIPTVALSLSLAFLKIQDQPFSHFLASLVLYMIKPRSRTWQKLPEMEGRQAVQEIEAPSDKKKEKTYKGKKVSETNLQELSYILDTHGLEEQKKPSLGIVEEKNPIKKESDVSTAK